MVLEAFAIVGLVTGTIGAINTVKGWIGDICSLIQDYKEIGATVEKLQVTLLNCVSELGTWKRLWGLDDKSIAFQYIQELWHEEAIHAIIANLKAIETSTSKCRELIQPFVSSTDADVRESARSNTFERVVQTLIQRKIIKREASVKKILTFISKNSKILTEHLNTIQDQIASIRRVSFDSYNERHEKTLPSNFNSIDLNPAQRTHLLKLVLEGRLAAQAIYRSCSGLRRPAIAPLENIPAPPLRQLPIYLEIDLIRDDGSMDIRSARLLDCLQLDFDLIIPDPSMDLAQQQLRQMLIHGPLPLDTRDLQTGSDVLVRACKALHNDGYQEFDFKLSWPQGKTFRFRSRSPLEGEKLSLFHENNHEDAFMPLKTLLYKMDPEGHAKRLESFQWPERYCLAFKLAECGLMLCGTSWFSELHIHQIRRSKKKMTEPRKYVLVRNAPIGEAEVGGEEGELYIERHVRRLGRLLVELATGRIIREIWFPPGGRTTTPEYKMRDVSISENEIEESPKRETESKVLDDVAIAMGSEYRAVVKFCLGKKEKHWCEARQFTGPDRELAYNKVLTDYYIRIYQPLKDIADGEGLRASGPLKMQRSQGMY